MAAVEAEDTFVDQCAAGLRTFLEGKIPPPLTAETVVGGIYKVVYTQVLRGETQELPALLPDLAYSSLLPYLGSGRRAAESDLVAVGVTVGGLAHAVGVGLAFSRLDAAPGDLGHEGVEVVDEDRLTCGTGTLGVLVDDQEAVLRELPDSLGRMRGEGRRRAEQALVPGQRRS